MLAFFISPHGLGHAARACAVMEALLARRPRTRFRLFTSVPRRFFEASLPPHCFTYRRLQSDIGLIQKNPLEEDLPATRRALERLYPPPPALLDALAADLQDCRAVLCDIAPLGLSAARRAARPSVLIENFTWDWIYRQYGMADGGGPLADYAQILVPLFAQADFHIQTEPRCAPHPQADAVVPPVARRPRHGRRETRAALGVPAAAPLLLLSLADRLPAAPILETLARYPRLHLLFPGGEALPPHPRLHTPPREAFYHPDLVHAADYILAKAGYSTVAEAFHAGLPFAYLARPRFPESAVLADFIEGTLGGVHIPLQAWQGHTWPEHLAALLAMPRRTEARPNGADLAARHILRWCFPSSPH